MGEPRISVATRQAAIAGIALVCLTLTLFVLEWRTLASLEQKTTYAVRQDLRRAADAAVQKVYAYLESQAVAAFGSLTHRDLHIPDPETMERALRNALGRVDAASAAFVDVSCVCRRDPAKMELVRGDAATHDLIGGRQSLIKEAARVARTLPNSSSRDIWVAAAPDSGVFVFRSVDAGMAPRSNFVGFEIPGSALSGKVLADLVATIPREAGQPELTFAIGPLAKLEPDVGSEFGAAIPGLKLAAGYRGTTIAALARKQFWMHLGMIALVLGSIAFGLVFTLRGAQRESRAAAVKTAFLAHVSHEMKTPLAAIHLYAETLEMGRISDPAKQEQYLKRIREEAEHVAAMVNDVLEFSRMADGKRQYRIIPEDPNSIAETAAQACEQTSHVPVRLESDPDLPAVVCDQSAIRQALGNLLSNAVKYRGQSSEVGLRLERQNGHVLFRVTDHGIGIPPDEQTHIFERFYRADDDRVRATPGNGLGLSIARDIVTAHGGEIQVASEPGQGSTFTIALPAAARS